MWLDLLFFFFFLYLRQNFLSRGEPLVIRHPLIQRLRRGEAQAMFSKGPVLWRVRTPWKLPAARGSGSSLTNPVHVWERRRRQVSSPGCQAWPWEWKFFPVPPSFCQYP